MYKRKAELVEEETADNMYSLAITNQRETVVVWNKHTGKPVYNEMCIRDSPREWLNDVISKLPYYLAPKSERDLKELLPDVWRK